MEVKFFYVIFMDGIYIYSWVVKVVVINDVFLIILEIYGGLYFMYGYIFMFEF